MRIEEVVGINLKRARVELEDWSQAQLGSELEAVQGKGRGWSRQAVHAAERGQRAFGVSDLLVLALVFQVPVSWFLTPPKGTSRIELRKGVSIPAREVAWFFEAQPTAALDHVLAESSYLREVAVELEDKVMQSRELLDSAVEDIQQVVGVAKGVRDMSERRRQSHDKLAKAHGKNRRKK